jgi:hypothetical protein
MVLVLVLWQSDCIRLHTFLHRLISIHVPCSIGIAAIVSPRQSAYLFDLDNKNPNFTIDVKQPSSNELYLD